MAQTINNPGGGDCGFYAMAIGLVDCIQREYQQNKSSKTFDRWQAQGLTLSLETLLQINLKKLQSSPYSYKKTELQQMQLCLRAMSAESYKAELLSKAQEEQVRSEETLSLVESSSIFGKFMDLVKLFERKPQARISSDITNFNELALSPKTVDLAKKTATSLRAAKKDAIQAAKPGTLSFADKEVIDNSVVKTALVSDILVGDTVNPNSVILAGVDAIKQRGRWATHSDLKEVASKLEVNLHVANKQNGALHPEWPTIQLFNSSNVHWTTMVNSLVEPQLEMAPTNPPAKKTPRKPALQTEKSAPISRTDSTVTPTPQQHKTRQLTSTAKLKGNRFALLDSEPTSDEESSADETQQTKELDTKAITKYQTKHSRFSDWFETKSIYAVQLADSVKKRQIAIENLDTATGEVASDKSDKSAQEQLDKEFAERLQDAEYRSAGFYR